ncbi:glycoprotein-N-acetylgalactosamine 3-beta-galactosyltransferase 1-like isoform X1 [Malaya genurostris]|uniref:glycoprotein-N-acetylgalactosamine 3-beta-galactosyltransferase 1-like isoform X1 n=1 Tax=Malaya genurostris TaxID=325434 RepID=UPI0026F3E712|nr:glycoprotein-N-acetylgalactosamine 3-beta-galactosyltransferase 1-like isoform X1 [Malaya genurostris]
MFMKQLSIVQRKLPISRKQLAFLSGLTVTCLFMIVSVLQLEPNEFPDRYRTGYREEHHLSIDLSDSVRVLCWVMTTPENHESKAIHVKQTWGRRCNKLLLMSTVQDVKLETIALSVNEGRQSLWNKTRAAFRYVYEHHLNDYDWFLKADDDTYVIVENLRYFLYAYSPKYPIYFGSKFRYPQYVKQGYFSGGAGYVLSQEALKRFVEQGLHESVHCPTTFETEDLEMGRCMEYVNVTAGDSRDLFGRKRFLPLEPAFHLTSNPSDDPDFWYKYYSFYEPFYGIKCCSDMAISFHYIHGPQMHVIDYLIYSIHPYGLNYHNPFLPAKKSLEEAMIVAGPYPAETTSVRTTSSTESSTTNAGDDNKEKLSTIMENLSEIFYSQESASDSLDQIGTISSLSSIKNDASPEPINVDSNKIDDFIDRVINDKKFIDKLIAKLQQKQSSS